jgi:hypothetical protein
VELDFDKQTDAILRDLAKGNSFVEISQKTHLDADELSAFAENVLPQKAKMRATKHLADCSNCRKILTNISFLNSETESETIHEGSNIIAPVVKIPWYRAFFAFPNLAYAMGALTLLLGGSIAFLVFQSSKDSELNVAQVDKTYEKPTNIGGTSSEGDSVAKETYSANTASNAANVAMPAANSAANSSSPNAPVNPNVTSSQPEAKPLGTPSSTTPTVSGSTLKDADKIGEESPADLKNKEADVVESKQDSGNLKSGDDAQKPVASEQVQTDRADNNVSQRQVQELPNVSRNQSNIILPDAQNGGKSSPAPPPAPMKKSRSEAERRNKNETSDNYVVTKTIGSKTFQSLNGVWTDSAYKGGGAIAVKRGSDDYKKLDSGLQNIGGSLSGAVIVVWNGKNYRIQ